MKHIDKILKYLKPIKKPKVVMINFNAKEVKETDIRKFRNLWIKLGVDVIEIKTPEQLIGRVAHLVVIDEVCEWKK